MTNCKLCFYTATWGDWGPWGRCSVTCDTGFQERIRVCNDSSTTGAPCNGLKPSEIQQCQEQVCRKCTSNQSIMVVVFNEFDKGYEYYSLFKVVGKLQKLESKTFRKHYLTKNCCVLYEIKSTITTIFYI